MGIYEIYKVTYIWLIISSLQINNAHIVKSILVKFRKKFGTQFCE